ncbi:MAG: hypothetical protein FWD57_16840 [Polyangiaceae bacterium]|nr:hypothetical protein [Polyangiaceae bacterium]
MIAADKEILAWRTLFGVMLFAHVHAQDNQYEKLNLMLNVAELMTRLMIDEADRTSQFIDALDRIADENDTLRRFRDMFDI